MKIDTYEYQDISKKGYILKKVEFQNLNLIIGYSGSGKTRLLNTILNLGRSSTINKVDKVGNWKVEFHIAKKKYSYELKISKENKVEAEVEKEHLKYIDHSELMIERDSNQFKYNGDLLPQLKKSESAISILQNEEVIKNIYSSFASILKRSFSYDASDVNYLKYGIITEHYHDIISSEKNILEKLLLADTNLNIILYAMKEKESSKYKLFKEFFMNLFNEVEDIDIKDIQHFFPKNKFKAPIFCIKEKGVEEWIEFSRLSSGMQKVIIMMSDTLIINNNWIYLIDEYENSLGPKIIDFFYNWIQYAELSNQFFITSHHPFVINNIPIKNWYLCSRGGDNVEFIYGDELEKIIGKSNQSAFTKLMNSPLYGK